MARVFHHDRRTRHHAGNGELPDMGGHELPIQMIVTCCGTNSPLSIQPDALEIATSLEYRHAGLASETAQTF